MQYAMLLQSAAHLGAPENTLRPTNKKLLEPLGCQESSAPTKIAGAVVANSIAIRSHVSLAFPGLLERQFNGSFHRRKRRLNRFSMTNGKTGRFHVKEFPSTFGSQFTIPREYSGKWEIEFEYSCGDHPSLGCKRISGQQRTIPDIHVRHVARRVSRRGDSLQGADTIAIVEAMVRVRFHAWETKKFLTAFARIQREVTIQQARFTLSNEKFACRKLAEKSVNRTHMINMSVRQNDSAYWRIQGFCCPQYPNG
jgi:hypothetical protein